MINPTVCYIIKDLFLKNLYNTAKDLYYNYRIIDYLLAFKKKNFASVLLAMVMKERVFQGII